MLFVKIGQVGNIDKYTNAENINGLSETLYAHKPVLSEPFQTSKDFLTEEVVDEILLKLVSIYQVNKISCRFHWTRF